MTVRRRLAPGERRDEILRAALQLFAQRPADRVSVEQVAAAAGASTALVHHYFGSKPELTRTVLAATADELVGLLSVDAALPSGDQVRVGLTVYLDYLAAHPHSWGALLRAGQADDTPVAAIAERVDEHALALARRAVDDAGGELLDLALRGWLAMVKDVCSRWLDAGATEPDRIRALLEVAFAGCVAAARQA